jgi:hypothetical protein
MDSNNQSLTIKLFLGFITFVIIVLLATLPFHYVSYSGNFRVFPKDNLTFSNTIILQEDIDNITKRYYDASTGFEQLAIRQEPLFRKLVDHGIIAE